MKFGVCIPNYGETSTVEDVRTDIQTGTLQSIGETNHPIGVEMNLQAF
jgi:hypothetical protein